MNQHNNDIHDASCNGMSPCDMVTIYIIEYRECVDIAENWEEWNSDSDPVQLLHAFVEAVSTETIDDVNLYWRLREETP